MTASRSFAEPVRDPEAWAAEASTPAAEQAAFAERLLVISSRPSLRVSTMGFPGAPPSAPLDLAGATYLDVCDPASAQLSFSLNRRPKGSSSDDLWPLLMNAAQADFVLWVIDDEGKDPDAAAVWRLATIDENDLPVIRNVRAPTGGFSRENVGFFLRGVLGYDAVVVSQAGEHVLLKTPDLSSRSELSAVALVGTAKELFVTRASAKADTWLKLVRGGARYSVFRVVSTQRQDPLDVGAKVLLERTLSD